MSLSSRALGAAPLGPSLLLRARDLDSPVPLQLPRAAGPTVQRRAWGGTGNAGTDAGQPTDHRADRGARHRQGGAGLLCPGSGRPGRRQATAGSGDLSDDDAVAAGDVRPVAPGWSDPGGDGGNQRLLETAVLPAGGGPVSYTHLRAHETPEHLVCRLLLEKK